MVETPKNLAKNELRPFIPLLIGQGKLARHLGHYLESLSIPFDHWPNARHFTASEMIPLLTRSSAAWILVSDQGISEVATQISSLAPDLPILHSSASLSLPGTHTLHPLQTFGPELYPCGAYSAVPFIWIREEWTNQSALKDSIRSRFPNPHFEIGDAERALYHAYCVMMANFPQLLWGHLEEEAFRNLHLPAQAFSPILAQTTANFLGLGMASVTGPLVRGDQMTIKRHEQSLAGFPRLLSVYHAFVELFSKSNSVQKESP